MKELYLKIINEFQNIIENKQSIPSIHFYLGVEIKNSFYTNTIENIQLAKQDFLNFKTSSFVNIYEDHLLIYHSKFYPNTAIDTTLYSNIEEAIKHNKFNALKNNTIEKLNMKKIQEISDLNDTFLKTNLYNYIKYFEDKIKRGI